MHDALAWKLLNATRIIRRDPTSSAIASCPRNSHEGNTPGKRREGGVRALNPNRLILPERNFTTRLAPDLIYAHNQSSIYVIAVTHAMTPRCPGPRISHRGFCCAIDAETWRTRPSSYGKSDARRR